MDWSQALYLGLLCVACWFGRRTPWLCAIMAADFAATVALASNPLTVGIVDLIAVTALICLGGRGYILAGLFVAMIPIYILGRAFEWPPATTYGIVDAIACCQLGVLGRGDRGIVSLRRTFGGLFDHLRSFMARGRQTSHNMAGIDAAHRGGLNDR